jgi:hypothetical protein
MEWNRTVSLKIFNEKGLFHRYVQANATGFHDTLFLNIWFIKDVQFGIVIRKILKMRIKQNREKESNALAPEGR